MTSSNVSCAIRWCGRLGVSAVALVGTLGPVMARLGSTDGRSVHWFGWTLPLRCAFQERYGQPCGSCGLTRSWILTAHGSLQSAQQLHVHGPTTFFATLLAGVIAWCVLLSVRAAWLSLRVAATLVVFSLVVLTFSFAPIVNRNLELRRTVAEVR
jgi:hypothetical protein